MFGVYLKYEVNVVWIGTGKFLIFGSIMKLSGKCDMINDMEISSMHCFME